MDDSEEIDALQDEAVAKSIDGMKLSAFPRDEKIIVCSWKGTGPSLHSSFLLSVDSAKTLLLTLQLSIRSAEGLDTEKLN